VRRNDRDLHRLEQAMHEQREALQAILTNSACRW
jgi:hypothetical protein